MKYTYLIVFILCIGLVDAKLFSIDNTVTPTFMGCSITGCTMQGSIDMNGFIIYNATFVNASIHEFDPIFTAQNGTLWQAINSKLNISDQRYNDTLLIIAVNQSLYLELDNYYTKNESNGNFYPLNSNPAGYITLANITDNWVNITGDTMTGNLNMSNNNITDVDILFVHNISGRSPIHILSEVISNNTITADTFYGNINGTNGTLYGVTINNGTITNLMVANSAYFDTNVTFNGSLIPEYNNTYSLGKFDKLWKDFYVQDLIAANISSPDIDALYNITSAIIYNLSLVNSSIKQPSGPYLANDSTSFWVNESALNTTINNISKVRKMTYTMNCTGPNCNVISGINISYQITEVKVIPTSNSPYRFSLTEYPNTALIIDKNLQAHIGTWDISKNYVVDGLVQANIINGNAEQYNITITYLQNGVQ
jgi:hypothetical protein